MWEAIVKLVKRNKAASITAGVAAALLLAVVGVSYWINYEARQRAETSERQARQALADLQSEQRQRQQAEAARRAERKKSVPAFVGAARTALAQMKNDDALAHLRAALDYDPENAEALLLESQLLICAQDYAGAVAELGKYLALRPDDADAKKLAELAAQATPDNDAFASAFSEVFSRQKAHYLAASLSQGTNKLRRAYKQRLDEGWPGLNLGMQLSVTDNGGFCLQLNGHEHMGDITPLTGVALTKLTLQSLPVRDLTPLKGMQLTWLHLGECGNIVDLSPLKGMPLKYLACMNLPSVTDLTSLGGMPLTSLQFEGNSRVKDFSFLKGMKLDHLHLCVTSFEDAEPLKGMPLTTLELWRSPIGDLAPLVGMKLTDLNLNRTRVRDLTPLKGMPLDHLCVSNCRITDLTPLQGMPLRSLRLDGSAVTDLSPLEGLKLDTLYFTPKRIVKGMEIIRSMTTLTRIGVETNPDRGWPPAEFWKKYDAGEFK